MTPEHGSKSEENCNLRSAKAGHSSNICLKRERETHTLRGFWEDTLSLGGHIRHLTREFCMSTGSLIDPPGSVQRGRKEGRKIYSSLAASKADRME